MVSLLWLVCHEAEESDNSKINTEWHEVSVDIDLTTLITVVMSSKVSNIVQWNLDLTNLYLTKSSI